MIKVQYPAIFACQLITSTSGVHPAACCPVSPVSAVATSRRRTPVIPTSCLVPRSISTSRGSRPILNIAVSAGLRRSLCCILTIFFITLELLRIAPEEGINHDLPFCGARHRTTQVHDLAREQPIKQSNRLFTFVV